MVKNWIVLGDAALDDADWSLGIIRLSPDEIADWKNIAMERIKAAKTERISQMAFGYQELPKRPRPKKGSFDWLYNQGEKSYLAKLNYKATELDYANMRAVAEAYRTGNGVRQNLRLADCWEEMAQP